jgi:hypothetical protein
MVVLFAGVRYCIPDAKPALLSVLNLTGETDAACLLAEANSQECNA